MRVTTNGRKEVKNCHDSRSAFRSHFEAMARAFSVLPLGLLALYLLLSCHYAVAEGDDDGKDESPEPASLEDMKAEDESATPTSHEGKEGAEGEACEKPCGEKADPVCGSDGVTYANMCNFLNAKRCKLFSLIKLSDGECGEDICKPTCPQIKIDVCGSDGNTYDNYCEFRKAHCEDKELTIINEGKCE